MNKKELLKQALLDQKEIFGDDFFEKVDLERKTIVVEESFSTANSLDELYESIHTCIKCPLGEVRKNFVFGEGSPKAKVLLVGEGPGAEEDAQGRPFVGRAGELLNKILAAIGFQREEVFIANIVKCRPPANRVPHPTEAHTCLPYLHKQIELINPDFILCLGTTAAQYLLSKKESLGNMRNQTFRFHNADVVVTFHPAALLRNPNWKKETWEDVQRLKKMYDEKHPS